MSEKKLSQDEIDLLSENFLIQKLMETFRKQHYVHITDEVMDFKSQFKKKCEEYNSDKKECDK